ASVSPTRSREFDRTRSCGSLVWVTTCGLDGSVTSTTEKLIGAHSWAMYMMRRPSRVFCSPIPSPPLPKPPRSLWPIKRMFLLSVPSAVAGALIDVSSVSCVWNTRSYVGVRRCSILPVKWREVAIMPATDLPFTYQKLRVASIALRPTCDPVAHCHLACRGRRVQTGNKSRVLGTGHAALGNGQHCRDIALHQRCRVEPQTCKNCTPP